MSKSVVYTNLKFYSVAVNSIGIIHVEGESSTDDICVACKFGVICAFYTCFYWKCRKHVGEKAND